MIVWPEEAGGVERIGGKAEALRRLGAADLPVPPWFALTPDAFLQSLEPCRREALEAAEEPGATAQWVAEVEAGPEVRCALQKALERLCPQGELAAVRSSAVDEDGGAHSFAGQLESYLNVTPDQVAARAADVWRSGFSERILAYRREKGLPLLPRPPAVLIQRMVDAETAGVAFSADPVSGRRSLAVVAAVYGLGAALVGGESDADTFQVARDGRIVSKQIVEKRTALRAAPIEPDGCRLEAVAEERAKQSALTNAQAVEVAMLARRAERYFGRPQDIEWAMEAGRLFLLQSRPITTLAELPDPEGVLTVWDNSNIAESYSGVTTPLTFSFARSAYEQVYRQLCRELRVPADKIAGRDLAFRNLLGLIRGRVYYHLPHWYQLLALLPGYSLNRRYMEQMMGVGEALPEELVHQGPPPSTSEKLRDGLSLLNTLFGLAAGYTTLPRRIARFYARLDRALSLPPEALAEMRPDELASHYHDLEQQLLTCWDAPLVNDLFAMIFHGTLRRLAVKRRGPEAEGLSNDLVRGVEGIVSMEPARRIQEMAALACEDPALVALLREGDPIEARRALERRPELHSLYESYLAKFGDRCLEELKLESTTLYDDPLPLLRAIGHLASQGKKNSPSPATPPRPSLTSESVEVETGAAVGASHAAPTPASTPSPTVAPASENAPDTVQNPKSKVQLSGGLFFRWVLRNARDRVRDRENLRFERTRVFGRVRRIFLELGRRFHALDLLDDPRDVFYLEVEEALGFVEGVATCTDLRGLAAVRKAEFARYRDLPPPADRFETRGIVYQGNLFQGRALAEETEGEERRGLPCCPGRVRGPVRVITDPRGAELRPGTILVAERTDPGWVLLFPAASGLLVERGSLLSHSAIVAREMNLPAIVAIPGVTRWLQNGDEVEMDGGSGVIRRLNGEKDKPQRHRDTENAQSKQEQP